MWKTWLRPVEGLLDLVFPPLCPACGQEVKEAFSLCKVCGSRIRYLRPPWCPVCGCPYSRGPDHLCQNCRRQKWYFDRARSSFVYQGPVAKLIALFKYRGQLAALRTLLSLVGPLEAFEVEAVIPVPLPEERLRERTFNQAWYLARALFPGLNHRYDLLVRHRTTVPQVKLPPRQRELNVRGAFSLRAEVAGMRLLLVDDVFTTGATVNECARILKAAGAAKVFVYTLARA